MIFILECDFFQKIINLRPLATDSFHGNAQKRGRKTVPMGDCSFLKNRPLLLPVKFIKCRSLWLVIQSEVKGFKVFPEAAS